MNQLLELALLQAVNLKFLAISPLGLVQEVLGQGSHQPIEEVKAYGLSKTSEEASWNKFH